MKRRFSAICAVGVAVAFSGCGGGGGGGEKPAPALTPLTISLKAVDTALNQTGSARLESAGTKTQITIAMSNEPKGDSQPVFMAYGLCGQLNSYALFPLSDLVDGRSVSVFDLPFDQLLSEGPDEGGGPGPHHSPMATPTPGVVAPMSPASFAITVWRYTAANKTLVACGDHPGP